MLTRGVLMSHERHAQESTWSLVHAVADQHGRETIELFLGCEDSGLPRLL